MRERGRIKDAKNLFYIVLGICVTLWIASGLIFYEEAIKSGYYAYEAGRESLRLLLMTLFFLMTCMLVMTILAWYRWRIRHQRYYD